MQVDALLKQAGLYLEYTNREFAQDIETNSRFLIRYACGSNMTPPNNLAIIQRRVERGV